MKEIRAPGLEKLLTALAHTGLAEPVEARPTERFLDGPSSTGSECAKKSGAKGESMVRL
jgi:hypothetical protein